MKLNLTKAEIGLINLCFDITLSDYGNDDEHTVCKQINKLIEKMDDQIRKEEAKNGKTTKGRRK